MEKLTGVGGHGQLFLRVTMRAGKHGLRHNRWLDAPGFRSMGLWWHVLPHFMVSIYPLLVCP